MTGEKDEIRMTFTLPFERERWVHPMQAKRSMHEIIRQGLRKLMAQSEGRLAAVIPIGSGVQGMRYEIICKDVPDRLLQHVILPAMREHGFVQLHTREEVEVESVHRDAPKSLERAKGKVLESTGAPQDLTENSHQEDLPAVPPFPFPSAYDGASESEVGDAIAHLNDGTQGNEEEEFAQSVYVEAEPEYICGHAFEYEQVLMEATLEMERCNEGSGCQTRRGS